MRVLTFLAMAAALAAGQAQNVALFWNLYDAVVTGGRILHDVADGVGAVSKAIRAIDTFLDASAEAEITEALADAPKEEPAPASATPAEVSDKTKEPPATPSVDPLPSFSGCGALGFHIRDASLPMESMTSCCSALDTCYSASCRANKRDCDGKLRTCLFSACDQKKLEKAKQQSCRAAAKLLFSGTMALSFQQYNTAQAKLACPKPEKYRKRR